MKNNFFYNNKYNVGCFSKILIAAMFVSVAAFTNAAYAENTTGQKSLNYLKEVTLSDGKYIDENGQEVTTVVAKYEKNI